MKKIKIKIFIKPGLLFVIILHSIFIIGPFSMKNKSDILSSIAFSRQQYYRVNYLNEFGKTEDFPYGFLLKLTGGYSFAEFHDRTYTAIKVAYGGVLKRSSLYWFRLTKRSPENSRLLNKNILI